MAENQHPYYPIEVMREASPPMLKNTTLMTVNTAAENRTAPEVIDGAAAAHSLGKSSGSSNSKNKRDDAMSLSSISKEQKEDDSYVRSNTATTATSSSARPTSESGRARGATPPRPKGIVRNRSHDDSRGNHRRRSASPNRIPRVPNKPPLVAAVASGDANSISQNSASSPRQQPQRLSLQSRKDPSCSSLASGGSSANHSWQWNPKHTEKSNQEQNLFEQRLCEDAHGVAVRKINQNGKPNLRYVKCLFVEGTAADPGAEPSPSNRSSSAGSSFVRGLRGKASSAPNIMSSIKQQQQQQQPPSSQVRVLTWGKKKDVRLSLDKFVCVRKGKTTDRARRNSNPSCRILSLITNDPNHPSLDIEAPTRLDRDKFARAFARFLDVPLVGEDKTAQSVSPRPSQAPNQGSFQKTGAMSEPDMVTTPKQAIAEAKRIQQQQQLLKQQQQQQQQGSTTSSSPKAPLPIVTMTGSNNSNNQSLRRHSEPAAAAAVALQEPPVAVKDTVDSFAGGSSYANIPQSLQTSSSHHSRGDHHNQVQIASLPSSLRGSERSSTQAATASRPTHNADLIDEHHNHPHRNHEGDEASQVSSLTGAGFDQEIVEELHQALTELKAELEESRAEAARAVKVAEQAIQSAENSNSNDWNSTVTHKAAEAAALAQKKSAEAMAKQRLAEERLEGERRTAAFWRRQAEAAEEEAGALQTRAAAAEVQRAAMTEELECERRKTATLLHSMKSRYSSSEQQQKDSLEAALERNRALELELEASRRDLIAKSSSDEGVSISSGDGNPTRKKFNLLGRGKKKHVGDNDSSRNLLSGIALTSSAVDTDFGDARSQDIAESCQKLFAEAASVRSHFEMLRKVTADELQRLPEDAKMWAIQASQAITEAQAENSLLREKLASESATRRKLLHEVQDLRGVVRVYCRPKVSPPGVAGMLSIPSQETLLLQPYEHESPMSFKFDRVFTPDVQQREVYNEIEELCLSVMDGYNICLMAHGQTGTGKTYSLLGDVNYFNEKSSQQINVEIKDHGIHLKTVQQLFSISEHRSERYQDVFTLDIVEVHNERLCDLLAGTEVGELRGQVTMEDSRANSRRSKRGMSADDGSSAAPPMLSNSHSVSSKQGSTMTKLEIRTNHNGDTVVQGLLSVEVNSFEDVYSAWQQCLAQRANRLAEQGVDVTEYEASSHVIATLSVVSVNISTGIGSTGKIKFVDLAGADLVHRRGGATDPKMSSTPDSNPDRSNSDWKYSNRSLATLNDVVNCRSQYMRSVPYRNSTLTHLLRDNLEADTKVLLLLCVSADPKDLQETACALRFASGMRRVTIGKATKHSLTKM